MEITHNLLLFCLLLTSSILFSQAPANDDCSGAILIPTPESFCSGVTDYSNVNATTTAGLGIPANCTPAWATDTEDVWFTFLTPLTSTGSFDISVYGNTLTQPQIAVYRGNCPVIVEEACAVSAPGVDSVTLTVIGLNPGSQYWIRVNDDGIAGDFQLCMEEFQPPVNMMNGSTGSCSGTIYDSGGPNGPYGPSESFIYTICPTNPHSCLILDISTYDFETNFDNLVIHNGPNTLGPVIGNLTGVGGNETFEANSGCMTLNWNSSATVQNAGWVAEWYCTQDPCSPDGSGIMPPDQVTCSGDFFDSGLDTTGYLNNENWTFNICPNVPNSCIILTLDNYDTQAGVDVLSFWDGPTPIGAPMNTISGTGAGATIVASSGCLTVGFVSDFALEGSGWSGSWVCTTDPCPIPTPIVVTTGVPDSVLIDNIASPEVVVSNVTLTCDQLAYGVFTVPGLSEFGLQNGIILSTGDANEASGPNSAGGTTTDLGQLGDLTLDSLLSPPNLSQDACALEFDVYASTNTLEFNYVFGSEEYPEYAPPNSSTFNDIFGFFISGPGIVGSKNIALIPNTTTPVSINNINVQTNQQYYIDNASGITTEYDAFTTVLKAETTVIPCDTYHLKLVIADVGDGAFDSGVFIEAGSLTTGIAEISSTPEFSPDVDYTIEGCAQGFITVSLSEVPSDTFVIYLNTSGTAINGTDYNMIADSIIFLPGQTSVDIIFSPTLDTLTEGIETAIFVLQQITGCGTFVYDSTIIEIHDNVSISLGPYISGDTIYVCKGDSVQLDATGAVDYQWFPNIFISDDTIGNPIIYPDTSTWYYVTGGVVTCNTVDSLFIRVYDPGIDIPLPDTIAVCASSPLVQLLSVPVEMGGLYSWEPGGQVVDSTQQNPAVIPDSAGYFYVTYDLGGCLDIDSVYIDYGGQVPLSVIPDTTICLGEGIILGNTANGAVYTWSPTTGLSNPNVANPAAFPTQTTTYYVTGSDGQGNCVVMDSVTIEVGPGIEVDAGPDLSICDDDTVQLMAMSQDSGAYLWVPSAGLDDPFSQTPTASPDTTTTYYVFLMDGNCEAVDSMTVFVQSGTGASVIPGATICLGDAVAIGGPSSPSTSYVWTPVLGLDDPTVANPIASPTQTTTYTLNATSANCASTLEVTVTVLPRPTLSTGPDQFICDNDPASISASGTGGTIFWSPDPTLSCTNCTDPTATPSQTTTYYVTNSNGTCSLVDSVTVVVSTSFNLQVVPDDVTIELGDSIELTAIGGGSGLNYTWTPNAGILGQVGQSILVSPSETTTYMVTGTAGDCEATGQGIVNIRIPDYGIPNVFSPNGDGLNDLFFLSSSTSKLSIEEFRIFDRWGQLLYDDEETIGWDGEFEGKELPQEVYVYKIVVRLPNDVLKTHVGDVLLLR